MHNPGYLRRRRRESKDWQLSERRHRKLLAKQIRAERTAARLGVQLVHWGVCPACGCIGAPNHRCAIGHGAPRPCPGGMA